MKVKKQMFPADPEEGERPIKHGLRLLVGTHDGISIDVENGELVVRGSKNLSIRPMASGVAITLK